MEQKQRITAMSEYSYCNVIFLDSLQVFISGTRLRELHDDDLLFAVMEDCCVHCLQDEMPCRRSVCSFGASGPGSYKP